MADEHIKEDGGREDADNNSSSWVVSPATDDNSLSGSSQHEKDDDLLLMAEDDDLGDARPSLIQRLCLNSRYSLRTQLILSFGTVSVTTILLVVAVCVAVAFSTGENVKSINQASFEDMLHGIEGTAARYLADVLAPKLLLSDVVEILYEATQDRFSGYSYTNLDGFVGGDHFVPFVDVESGSNQYPVRGAPLPLDWQIEGNVNDENYMEHVQKRWEWYNASSYPVLSTATAVYYMQGACDPNAGMFDMTYWPGCDAEANNNLALGGAVTPTPTNAEVHRRASDLTPILKALYEYNQNIQDLGIYFANGGAGGTISFPASRIPNGKTYESVGCDWMSARNPYSPLKPIATQEEIDRCRPAGESVPARAYNPLERAWCRDLALNPFEKTPHVIGPFPDAWKDYSWMIGVGKAVYDRVTSEFIGCIFVGSDASAYRETLLAARLTKGSEVSLVRWGEAGTIFASTAFDNRNGAAATSISELGVGVSPEYYDSLMTLVDFESEWEPANARRLYESNLATSEGFVVSAYPVPPIPETYEASYRPDFLVVISTLRSEFFAPVEMATAEVNDSILRIVYLSVIVAAGFILVAACVIYFMSKTLTAPLQYMDSSSGKVMSAFGSAAPDEKAPVDETAYVAPRCSPKTELEEVVVEYNKMLNSFSGPSVSKSSRKQYQEAANVFRLQAYFKQLYQSRQEQEDGKSNTTEDGESYSLEKINRGANTVTVAHSISGTSALTAASSMRGIRAMRPRFDSPLFLWTVLLIATPLLLATLTMSGLVLYTISSEFSNTLRDSQQLFIESKLRGLEIKTQLRAELIEGKMERPLRFLHLLTRYTSWVMFGGVEMTDGFTKMASGAEECRGTANVSDCGYSLLLLNESIEEQDLDREQKFVCDCKWNDDDECQDYDPAFSRRLQIPNWAANSLDSFPNGDRNSTAFPEHSTTANTTAWWPSQTSLPGYELEWSTTKPDHDTTFGRLRAAGATPLYALLFNTDEAKDFYLGGWVGFEPDGSYMGYTGCGPLTGSSRFMSSEGNGAAELRPELCPLGKYGYDPRCRDWYHSGRVLYLEDNSILQHITPPYQFGGGIGFYGQSATSPLFHPASKELLGEVLIDFNTDLSAISGNNTDLSEGGFSTLVAAKMDSFGGDTVIGPDFQLLGEGSLPIIEVILPMEHNCTTDECMSRRGEFERVVKEMKNGEEGVTEFKRLSLSGEEQTIFMAFAPVALYGYGPIDSSSFERGVRPKKYLVYSVGMAETETGLLEPFAQVEEGIQKQINISIGVVVAVVFVAILAVLWISYLVTLSFTHTVLFLLSWIRQINRLQGSEEPPVLDRSMGCQEIAQVADAMDALFRIVRCANTNYFAGDLETAYQVLLDALETFEALQNARACAVIYNNLGIIMLALFRYLEATGDIQAAGLTEKEIISRGTAYFEKAISLGRRELEKVDSLDLQQHLANRYFNRAIFLLTVRNGKAKSSDSSKHLALNDLCAARDIDVRVAAKCEEDCFQPIDTSDCFCVLLIRARGFNRLRELGYDEEDWDVQALLNNALSIFEEESRQMKSLLFASMTPVGVLQLIETELMQHQLLSGNHEAAAKTAIRMLVQDEFIIREAHLTAVKVLLAYLESPASGTESHNMARVRLTSYQRTLKNGASRAATADDDSSSLSDVLGNHTAGSRAFGALSNHHNKLSDNSGQALSVSMRSTSSTRSTETFNKFLVCQECLREDVVMETF